MATAIIYMEPMVVSLANANAYWKATDGAQYDWGCWAFKDAAQGRMWWQIPDMPKTAAAPNWNLIVHHVTEGGGGGNVVFLASGTSLGQPLNIDRALIPLGTQVVNVPTMMQERRTVITGLDPFFKPVEGERLVVEIFRVGDHVQDTVGTSWAVFGVTVLLDVPTQ